MEVSSTILDLCPRWKWVVSCTPGDRAPSMCWVGLRAGLDTGGKKNVLTLTGIKFWPSSLSLYRQLTQLYTFVQAPEICPVTCHRQINGYGGKHIFSLNLSVLKDVWNIVYQYAYGSGKWRMHYFYYLILTLTLNFHISFKQVFVHNTLRDEGFIE